MPVCSHFLATRRWFSPCIERALDGDRLGRSHHLFCLFYPSHAADLKARRAPKRSHPTTMRKKRTTRTKRRNRPRTVCLASIPNGRTYRDEPIGTKLSGRTYLDKPIMTNLSVQTYEDEPIRTNQQFRLERAERAFAGLSAATPIFR